MWKLVWGEKGGRVRVGRQGRVVGVVVGTGGGVEGRSAAVGVRGNGSPARRPPRVANGMSVQQERRRKEATAWCSRRWYLRKRVRDHVPW